MRYYIDNDQNIFRVDSGMLEKFSIEGKSWYILLHRISDWEIEENGLSLISGEVARRILEHKLLSSLDYDWLKELAGFIHKYKVEWKPGRRRENGVYILPYPNYDERVFEALEVLGFNNEYKYAPLPQCISQLTALQIRDYLTHLTIEERWCEGFISNLIEDHTLYKLLLRLLELYHQHFWVMGRE